jgi:hypothetical protein
MIKARGQTVGGAPILIFGLSRMNTDRLHAGMPIRVDLRELGLEGLLFIIAGETEEALGASLKDANLVGPDTVINDRKTGRRPQ